MGIYFSIYKNKALISPLHLLRKLFRKKYLFLKLNHKHIDIVCWHDKQLGCPFTSIKLNRKGEIMIDGPKLRSGRFN